MRMSEPGFRIEGCVALVTGAGGGIGAALAGALVDREAAVVIVSDLDGSAAHGVADRLRGRTATVVVATPLDVADGAAIRDLVATIEQEHGRLDLV